MIAWWTADWLLRMIRITGKQRIGSLPIVKHYDQVLAFHLGLLDLPPLSFILHDCTITSILHPTGRLDRYDSNIYHL